MKFYYASYLKVRLPKGHRFPMEKYDLLRHDLLRINGIHGFDLIQAKPATKDEILNVHLKSYYERVSRCELTEKELRRIGLPQSAALFQRTLASLGGTIAATESAIANGFSMNLGGGTHHAFPDHGEGYCIFNDVAVAAKAAQKNGLAKRILILDCDVHQGNGTAYIFREDDSVYTFSIHAEKNFPFRKFPSDTDIGLSELTDDKTYNDALKKGLQRTLKEFSPDLCIYIAGADPYTGDRLGRLNLTFEGMAERDQFVLTKLAERDIPVAIVLGGGYAKNIMDTVKIHAQTARIAANKQQQMNVKDN